MTTNEEFDKMNCAGNEDTDLTAYYVKNQTSKDKRRKNIERRKHDSDDYIYERPVKKPRRNKIRRYDYYNTDEEYYT